MYDLVKLPQLQVKCELKAQQLPLNRDIQRTQSSCQDQPCLFAVVPRTLKGITSSGRQEIPFL